MRKKERKRGKKKEKRKEEKEEKRKEEKEEKRKGESGTMAGPRGGGGLLFNHYFVPLRSPVSALRVRLWR